NAHDRTNAWHLDGGIFRFACANGLVVCDEEFGRIRIRHMGHEMNEIIESTEKFADHVCDLSNSLQTMKDTKLSKKERSDFALEALSIKYPKKEQLPFDSDLLLTTRRVEDEGHTLWNTLNVIQENLIKG
ncbi:MAG TPA: hypothetical protein DF712_09120, partial [Balneola sp.]|nr:hypothetical protein [Balneola sp.]